VIGRPPVLPLSRDASSRFLPWLIAFMVWLAAMALAVVMALSGLTQDWRQGLSGTLTVQITPMQGEDDRLLNRRVDSALGLLRRTPGIASADEIPKSRVIDLLEPWLGRDAVSGALNLPLPRLIDVHLAPGAKIDSGALGAGLAAAVPGATLDDHGLWLDRLITLAGAVEGIAYAVLSLIAFVAVATVVYATRAGLAIHREAIELMHIIGARDGYIARQFQGQTFWLALSGGICGLALAALTIAGLGYLAARLEAGLLPPIFLNPLQWAALASVALAGAAISMATARLTVMRALRQMP
jgi:cell division transport system permease protein